MLSPQSAQDHSPKGIIFLVHVVSPTVAELLQEFVTKQDYEVQVINQGCFVLLLAQTLAPILILLDEELPDVAATTLCTQLKTDPGTKDIPVVFFNSAHKIPDRAKIFQAGGAGYLLQPFQEAEVKVCLAIHTNLKLLQTKLETKEVQLAQEIAHKKRMSLALMRLSRVFEQSPSSIVIVDLEGRMEFVNPAFSLQTGYSPTEAIGENPRILQSGYHSPEFYLKLWQTITEGQVWQGEFCNKKKNGEICWESAIIAPIKDQEGQTLHYLGIKENITARKQAEEAIRQANAELALRVAELTILNKVARTLATEKSLQTGLSEIAEEICSGFHAQGTLIFLLNERQTSQIMVASAPNALGPPANTNLGDRFPLENDLIAAKVIKHTRSLIIPQAQTSPLTSHLHPLLRSRNIHCIMAVPLRARGKAIGMIIVLTSEGKRVFTTKEVTLAETIALQVASVIENARLFSEQQRSYKRIKALHDQMQAEMSLAQHFQKKLLPPPRPAWPELDVICYSAPAREVGGDLYAYHALEGEAAGSGGEPKRKFALAVGDVTGKGMPAALLMAVSLALFSSAVPQGLAPRDLLRHLDRSIGIYTNTAKMNCALCYMEITPPGENGELGCARIANSGSIPPFLKRFKGQTELINIGGAPLGAGFGQLLGYPELTVEVAPGDMLILTSDWVAEAKNETGEMFGFDRLEAVLAKGPSSSAQALLDYLKAALSNFVGAAEPHDDTTIVVVQMGMQVMKERQVGL